MPILTPEQQAREQIDRLLDAAGWQVQARDQMRLRANQHFTLKQNPLIRADLHEFVACYDPQDRTSSHRPGQRRPPTGAGGPTPTRN